MEKYTARDTIAGNLDYEDDDFAFGEDLTDEVRKQLRGMALRMLAIAATDMDEVQRKIDEASKDKTGESQMDEAYDATNRYLDGITEQYRVKLGLYSDEVM